MTCLICLLSESTKLAASRQPFTSS